MGKDIFDLMVRDVIGGHAFRHRLENHSTSTFPPHNVIQLSEEDFLIEMAVAGFKQSDITIKAKESELTISGVSPEKDDKHYVHRGLGFRNFSKTFILGEYIEVQDASIEDGLLKVNLKRVLPEAKKERIISINSVNNDNLLLG